MIHQSTQFDLPLYLITLIGIHLNNFSAGILASMLCIYGNSIIILSAFSCRSRLSCQLLLIVIGLQKKATDYKSVAV